MALMGNMTMITEACTLSDHPRVALLVMLMNGNTLSTRQICGSLCAMHGDPLNASLSRAGQALGCEVQVRNWNNFNKQRRVLVQ